MPRPRKGYTGERRFIAHPSDKPVALDLSREERYRQLAEALSNPMDLRSPEELTQDYGVSMAEYRALQNDPNFIEPITSKFYRSLSGAQVFVLRKLLRQVEEGNVAAARLTLQAFTGELGDGVKVNVLNVGGSVGGDEVISKLSDEELDREIHRLLMDTTPDELSCQGGRLVPSFEAAYEEVTNAQEAVVGDGHVATDGVQSSVSGDGLGDD
jgi:hypothetical protein